MDNLDVWAIEFHKKELDKALSKIKKNSISILYNNCVSELKINDTHYISKQYDTCIYNQESDLLILIKKSETKTNQKVRSCLEQHNILFHEVNFVKTEEEYEEDLNIPKLWFARDKDVLNNAIKNSKQKGINSCTFYPQLESELVMNYTGIDGNNPFDGRFFKGLVKLDDKYVFIINQNNTNNMNQHDVVNILLNQNMTIHISQEKVIEEIISENKGSKVLCKKI